MMPYGFKFLPTDEEIIHILERKVCGQEMPIHYFITQKNIYESEPQELEWSSTAPVSGSDKYYYYKKASDSREVLAKGFWKGTSRLKRIFKDGRLIGCKRPLTFHKYNEDRRNRSNCTKTDWIMYEYSLEMRETVSHLKDLSSHVNFTFCRQDWRLCKIKLKYNRKVEENEEEEVSKNDSPRSITCMSNTNPSYTGEGSSIWPMSFDIDEIRMEMEKDMDNVSDFIDNDTQYLASSWAWNV